MGRASQQMKTVLGIPARTRRRSVEAELERFTHDVMGKVGLLDAIRLRGDAVTETLSDTKSPTPVHVNIAARSPEAAQRAEQRLRETAVFDTDDDGRPRWDLHTSALGLELVAVVRPAHPRDTETA